MSIIMSFVILGSCHASERPQLKLTRCGGGAGMLRLAWCCCCDFLPSREARRIWLAQVSVIDP